MPPPTASRTIGRILSLGYPLPGPLVDNYTFVSAPAFFDYDALVVDIAALSTLLEDVISGDTVAETFAGVPIRTTRTAPADVLLRDILTQRREEAALLLERGGIIVAFTSPAVAHHIDDAAAPLDDYCWLPDDIAASCRAPAIHPSAGTRAHIVDFQHPLAAFAHGQLAHVDYCAYFDASAVPASSVFVRSEGGAAIGVELPTPSGRIIMLPAMKAPAAGDARYSASDALQAGIRAALGVMAPGREPPWATAFTLPGLDEQTADLESTTADLARAQHAADEAQRAHDDLARYRRLLWQEGALGLHDVVLDAMQLIGFQVYASDPNAIELRYADTTMLLEIAASEHSIDLDAHYRLRQRIEAAIAQRKSAPRGLLVVNGRRLATPAERSDEVTPALRAAAETMRYGIATTASLFAAVAAALAHDEAAVSAYRCRLLRDEGLIE